MNEAVAKRFRSGTGGEGNPVKTSLQSRSDQGHEQRS